MTARKVWQGIFARFGGVLALVYACFNPSGDSYYHCTIEAFILAPRLTGQVDTDEVH